ncbi:DUF7620 family protein [Mycolicibacterium komossense]|uniref:Uncharacterized protein n=1 Tax=Mycolicibacterium komossense TaxID=1779 RepID=A0ABT3CMP7_9MYCO|nr:hypothetical protein [Mycolicibacterium komossense]MCV7230652.1 hypothetical protein [Mycolicibacterium komossense]
MRWPWRGVAEAKQQLAEAQDRKRTVDLLVEESRQVSSDMHREVRRNGFSDMLQHAMGRG